MRNPSSLGQKAMVARDPFLDLLIRGALTGRLRLRSTRWVPTSSIIVAGAHFALLLGSIISITRREAAVPADELARRIVGCQTAVPATRERNGDLPRTRLRGGFGCHF